MNVGERIKSRRKQLGMTVDDLAEKVGKSRATVYRYENGSIEKLPTEVLTPFADALLTTPDYLMGWTDDPKKRHVLTFQKTPLMEAIDKAMEEKIENMFSDPDFINFDLLDKFDRLTEEDQKEVMTFIDFKLSKYDKKED